MAGSRLRVAVFDASLLPAVANIDCGHDGPWADAAQFWIAAPLEFPGALQSMRDYGTDVWLFYLGEHIVGFGSLGPTQWNGKTIGFIPQLGLCVDFHGQPAEAPRHERFSWQIMGHIVATAQAKHYPAIALSVDCENQKAKRFYENIGFADRGRPQQRYGRQFQKMALYI